jgi:hypothetical protein
MLLAWSAAACAPAHALDRRVEVFDAHAGAALPSFFSLPDAAGGERQVALLGRLPTDIEVDGRPASVYLARIDGRPGTIARVGDGLDIALDDEDSPRPATGQPVDRVIDGTGDLPPGGGTRTLAREAADAGAKAIDVWIFLHETSGEDDHARFVNWYLTWWAKDMDESVKPGVPVRMSVHGKVPGLTDMDYHAGRDVDRIRDVGVRGAGYARSRGARITSLTKFVLFVDEPARNWDAGTLGGAVEAYGAAIASNRGHRHIFAHEVGHLLGARHEDAERRLFCITNMKDSLWGVASCQYYSKPNDENIRRYVRARTGS